MQQSDLGLNLPTKKTRKREFLEQMRQVVPWKDLALIEPYAPEGRRGQPPFPVEMLLRIHFMQQWFTLSDPAVEETLHDMPLFRYFAGLSWDSATPDESIHPALSPFAAGAPVDRANPEDSHGLAGEPKAAAAHGHYRGPHVDRCAQRHQEQHQVS